MIARSCLVLLACTMIALGPSASWADHVIPEKLYEAVLADFYPPGVEGRVPTRHELHYQKLDLNEDQKPEYLVEGSFGYAGSAGYSLWIYREEPAAYRLIADIPPVSRLQWFANAVLHTKTRGYPDLLFKNEPASGDGPYFHLFVFNGTKYAEQKTAGPRMQPSPAGPEGKRFNPTHSKSDNS